MQAPKLWSDSNSLTARILSPLGAVYSAAGGISESDVMLAKRKIKGKALATKIGITEQNLSLLKSGKGRGVRFETLARICRELECQPGDLLEFSEDG